MAENFAYFCARDLEVALGGSPIIKDLDLEVAAGEFIALLGPSGCGKTTFLKTVAGLLAPSAGELVLDGSPLANVAPQKRGVVVVFQDLRLFPHMNVLENVAFGLRMQGVPKQQRHAAAKELLEQVGLRNLEKRRTRELSGGQQQRVALARALAIRPRLLLLDEPFSSLDANLRQRMRELVRQLHDQLHLTTILVTHDYAEALLLSDRIAMMFAGKLVQTATPRQILAKPATAQVAEYFSELEQVSEKLRDLMDGKP
jgi:ABC-type Fe3+/spermidine/putrescine transport system ATPase subunit